jgi:hypothetical protein
MTNMNYTCILILVVNYIRNIKMILKKQNGPLGSLKFEEFLDQPRNYSGGFIYRHLHQEVRYLFIYTDR